MKRHQEDMNRLLWTIFESKDPAVKQYVFQILDEEMDKAHERRYSRARSSSTCSLPRCSRPWPRSIR